jgi:hypothetical protein
MVCARARFLATPWYLTFGEAPQLLDHPKRMLAARVRERARLIMRRQRSLSALRLGRRLSGSARPGQKRLAVGFFQYASSQNTSRSSPMQQMRKLGNVRRARVGRGHGVDYALAVCPDMQLHAEVPSDMIS